MKCRLEFGHWCCARCKDKKPHNDEPHSVRLVNPVERGLMDQIPSDVRPIVGWVEQRFCKDCNDWHLIWNDCCKA